MIKCLSISLCFLYMCHIFMFKLYESCPWFDLVSDYKSVYERHLSRVMIQPHIDINYCVHENFIKCLNTSPCFPYIWHILMFKLDDAMPWFGLPGGCKLVYERRLSRVMICPPPYRYKLLRTWDFHIASHIQLLLCISFMWNMMLKLLCVLPQLHGS
jgi:hypothetical protein